MHMLGWHLVKKSSGGRIWRNCLSICVDDTPHHCLLSRDRRDPEVSRDQSVHLGSRVCLEQSALRVKLVTQAKR